MNKITIKEPLSAPRIDGFIDRSKGRVVYRKIDLGTVPRTQLIDSEGIHMDPARLNPSKIGTSPKIKFERGDKQEAAFQLLSKSCCSAPNPLLLPEGSEDFIAYCELQESGRCVDTRWKRSKRVEHEATRRVLELEGVNITDCDIRYHPGKANVVADALSRKE
ncbi:hypothetical protein Tco_0083961 [Tanacetum coccineum]